MANQYLKSVCTRFRNTPTRENEYSNQILNDFMIAESEGVDIDKEAFAEKLERCMEKIQQYREKLENQSEKLASAISETDPETYK